MDETQKAKIDESLAKALRLADSMESESKLEGLAELQCLVTNLTSTHLLWYSRCDVIYDCLWKMMYFNEESLVNLLYSTCLTLLKKCYPIDTIEFSKGDAVFQRLIEALSLEQKLSTRLVLTNLLVSYSEFLKVRLLMWRKELFRIYEDYLEDAREGAEPVHRNVLRALLTFCCYSAPRVNSFVHDTMVLTVKFCYEQFRTRSKLDDAYDELVTEIWEKAASQYPETFELVFEGLESMNSGNEMFVRYIGERKSELRRKHPVGPREADSGSV